MGTKPNARRPSSGPTRVTRTLLATLAAGALLLGACGDDDADDAAVPQEDPATTSTTTTTSTSPESEDDQESEVGEEALIGAWAHPDTGRTHTFTADGEFSVSADGEVLAEGTWTATPTTIEMVPESGAIACDESATYEWMIDGDTLTLTAVSDECPDRKAGLDGVPRVRVE